MAQVENVLARVAQHNKIKPFYPNSLFVQNALGR